jgi:hypothetical protein
MARTCESSAGTLVFAGLSLEVVDTLSNNGGSTIFTSPLGAVMEIPAETLTEVGRRCITYQDAA